MKEGLGEIKRVNVRTLWPNEAHDFTPWLAQEENIARLGDAVGMELEVESTETAVGPYSADILAKEMVSDGYVVIENQFGKTNHDHLGKLITYASALNATAIVWITENFTEEHERALNWLNDHTTDDLSFYGVQLEVFQIDESRPAMRFNVISRPAALAKQVASAKSREGVGETQKLQLEFWTLFREKLLAAKVIASAQTPRPQNWFNVPLGRSGIFLSNFANTWENRIGIRVYLFNRYAGGALPQLLEQKEEIERELGEEMIWNPNPDKRDKTILLQREANLSQRNRWDEYADWMVDRTCKIRKVFMPRVKQLDLGSSSALEEVEN